MSVFTKIIIRCAVDVTSREPFRDVFAGSTPRMWTGVGVEFQFAFFKGDGGDLLDVSDFQLVKAAILASTLTGLPFADKAAALVDTALTVDEWKTATSVRLGFERACHAYISFEGAELQLDPADYALVIHGSTTDDAADPDCFGITKLTAVADGLPITTGPLQAGNAVPGGAVYDGGGNYVLAALTANRVYTFTKNANDLTVVNGAQTLLVSGLFTAAGVSVTLTGAPGAAVTATVRANPALDTDTADARYLSISKPFAFADGIPLILPDDGLSYRVRVKKTPNGIMTLRIDQAGVAAPGFRKVPIFCADDNLYHDLTLVMDEGVITYTINPAGYNL